MIHLIYWKRIAQNFTLFHHVSIVKTECDCSVEISCERDFVRGDSHYDSFMLEFDIDLPSLICILEFLDYKSPTTGRRECASTRGTAFRNVEDCCSLSKQIHSRLASRPTSERSAKCDDDPLARLFMPVPFQCNLYMT